MSFSPHACILPEFKKLFSTKASIQRIAPEEQAKIRFPLGGSEIDVSMVKPDLAAECARCRQAVSHDRTGKLCRLADHRTTDSAPKWMCRANRDVCDSAGPAA